MTAQIRAIRGATTLDEDTIEQVTTRTQAMVNEILKRNELDPADLVSMIFTATDDIRSGFPATAARALGLEEVPLLGAVELAINGAPSRCVRVLAHCYTELSREEIRHVFLEGAALLRPDLAE